MDLYSLATTIATPRGFNLPRYENPIIVHPVTNLDATLNPTNEPREFRRDTGRYVEVPSKSVAESHCIHTCFIKYKLQQRS